MRGEHVIFILTGLFLFMYLTIGYVKGTTLYKLYLVITVVLAVAVVILTIKNLIKRKSKKKIKNEKSKYTNK